MVSQQQQRAFISPHSISADKTKRTAFSICAFVSAGLPLCRFDRLIVDQLSKKLLMCFICKWN